MRFWKRSAPKPPPRPCPDCGGPLALENRFCRKCGWDADLEERPDVTWEEGDATVERPRGTRVFWWCVAVLALYLMIRMTF